MPTAQRNREAGPEEGPEEAGEAGPEEGPGYHRSWRSRARRSGTASVRGILTLASPEIRGFHHGDKLPTGQMSKFLDTMEASASLEVSQYFAEPPV